MPRCHQRRGHFALSFLSSYVSHTANQSCCVWRRYLLLSRRKGNHWCIKKNKDTNSSSLFTKVLWVSTSWRDKHLGTRTQAQLVQKFVWVRSRLYPGLWPGAEMNTGDEQGYSDICLSMLPSFSSPLLRDTVSWRWHVFLVNNPGGLFLWTYSFSPWTQTNFKYQNFLLGVFPQLTHILGWKNTLAFTQCLLSAYLLWWPCVPALDKLGSTWSPVPTVFTGKNLKSGSRWLHLYGKPTHASHSSLRDMSREITGQHLIWAISLKKGLGEWFRNKRLSEDWGLLFCLAGCALTLFFSHLVIQCCDSCKWRASELK